MDHLLKSLIWLRTDTFFGGKKGPQVANEKRSKVEGSCRTFFATRKVAKRQVFAAALCSDTGLEVMKDPRIPRHEV